MNRVHEKYTLTPRLLHFFPCSIYLLVHSVIPKVGVLQIYKEYHVLIVCFSEKGSIEYFKGLIDSSNTRLIGHCEEWEALQESLSHLSEDGKTFNVLNLIHIISVYIRFFISSLV